MIIMIIMIIIILANHHHKFIMGITMFKSKRFFFILNFVEFINKCYSIIKQ